MKIFESKSEKELRLQVQRLQFDLGEARINEAIRTEGSKKLKVFSRGFEAGRMDRLSGDWSINPTSADQDVRLAMLALRQRARDLEQNEPIAAKWINLLRKGIVGPYGFNLRVKAEDVTPKGDKIEMKFQSRLIENAFKDWSRKKYCDVAGVQSFRKIQHMVVVSAFRDGEYLVRKIKNGSKYGFQLQVLEPDIIDERWTSKLDNGNVILMGVEYDKFRRRVAYWCRKVKPEINVYGGLYYSAERERIPASEIYYDFDSTRAFQSRGVTKMTPSMVRMHMMKTYEQASVTNAAISARRLAWMQRIPDKFADDVNGTDQDDQGNVIFDTEEGSIQQVPDGYEINQPDPKYPDSQHEPFLKSEGKIISSGLDVGFASLFSDLKEANYGSARQGLIDERESYQMHQEWFIESFLEPVFEDWLEAAIMTNNLPGLRMSQFDLLNKPYFTGRSYSWIDPDKDVSAKLKELRSGMTSLSRVAAERGDDLEELFQEIQGVNEKAKKYGIELHFEDSARETAAQNPGEGDPGEPADGSAKSNGQAGKNTI